jgi:LysW-gamma-L-lysine carboxypeptidase
VSTVDPRRERPSAPPASPADHAPMDRDRAVSLLSGLVAIRSLSGGEAEASSWLVAQAGAAGYERAFVDGAGNAVAELGAASAARTIVLLGHIDTVPGDIPVRAETRDGRPVLCGRGAVDAKGPLATFVAAGARLGGVWAREAGLRLVVVGAVEEEAASSKGARFVRDRFDGSREPVPVACVIGEPSRWDRVTIGYKGRLLVDLEARRPMTHSAGPEATAGTAAVGLWNRVEAYCAHWNAGRDKAFDQILPSLRAVNTESDGLEERATAKIGLRLPVGFHPAPLREELRAWAQEWVGAAVEPTAAASDPEPGGDGDDGVEGPAGEIRLVYRAHEPAWRGDSRNALVRAFLAAIRAQGEADAKPAFVVKTGTSDMNVVGPSWRCPILAYGPGDSRLDHTPDEHIDLDEYWRAVRVLERALRSFADDPTAMRDRPG